MQMAKIQCTVWPIRRRLPDDITSLPEDEIYEVVPSTCRRELRSALELMSRSSGELAGLTPWIDRFLQAPERQRRLLNHFGAIGQVGDSWGVDDGNVIYSIMWKYFAGSDVPVDRWRFHQSRRSLGQAT